MVGPEMASKTGSISPLQDLGTDRVRDKQTIGRAITRIRLKMLSLPEVL